MKNFIKGLLLGISVAVISYVGYQFFNDSFSDVKNSNDLEKYIIIINKGSQSLTVYHSTREVIKTYRVSTGENPGNKLMKGDLKTPEGIFPVIGIEDASEWSYDFKDGDGPIIGAYGPLFIRLKVNDKNIFSNVNAQFEFTKDNKFLGIGIHGTHLNELIGSRASHGCIRLRNEDLNELDQYIEPGTLVAIIPGKLDNEENNNLKYLN